MNNIQKITCFWATQKIKDTDFNTMKKRYSPLRWAGGKSKMIPFVNNVINQIENKNITFVQPFAGGAGVSLFMLGNSKVNKIIINDFDYGVYSFWHSVFFDNDNFYKRKHT